MNKQTKHHHRRARTIYIVASAMCLLILTCTSTGQDVKEENAVSESVVSPSPSLALELPGGAADADSFRDLTKALSAVHKQITVHDAGMSSTDPMIIEAELYLNPEVPFEVVEMIVLDLLRFGTRSARLYRPINHQNMILIIAPADASWRFVHEMETYLAKLETFKFDIRIRANNDPPTSTASPGEMENHTPVAPKAPEPVAVNGVDEFSERLLPLKLELAELRTKLGSSHPKVVALERRLAFTRDFLNKFAREASSLANEQLKIFNLKNSNASDVSQTVRQLFNGTTVSVDERTNALIVRAHESQLREIEAILLRLDSTEAAARNSDPTVLPSIDANAPVTSIAEYRSRLDALEQPVLQLAEQVRAAEIKLGKDHPDFARLRTDLRTLVQQTFTARQEIQRTELAEFTRRLQRMQQSIETRERIAEKIVERRLQELLNPNVMSTQPPPTPEESETATTFSYQDPNVIANPDDEKQSVTLVMFEVNEKESFKGMERDSSGQFVAPGNFDTQISKMLKDGTATILGSHSLGTDFRTSSTLKSTGSFNVPTTNAEQISELEVGTTIVIEPETVEEGTMFRIRWNERTLDWANTIGGIHPLKTLETNAWIQSPQPNTIYILGPGRGLHKNKLTYISFYLSGPTTAATTSRENSPKKDTVD